MAEPFRVGYVPGVSPGKWLRRWEQRLPELPLEARMVEVAEQRTLLLDGALDMCFVRLPVDREGLHVIPLYEEQPVVVAAREHPVSAFDELDVADLAGEHLLQPSTQCPEWAAVAEEVRDGTRVEPPPMSLPQAIEVAGSGAGIVVVPMSLARLHQRKDVRYVPVTGVAPSSVGLAWRTDNDDTRVETFVGIVRGRTERSSRQPEAAPRRPEQDVRQPGRDRARGADDRRRRRAKGAVKHRGRPRRR